MVNAVENGLACGHDFSFLRAGDLAHFGGEEVAVAAADKVGRRAHFHFSGRGFIGNDEAGLSVLEENVVGQVVDEGAEEVAVLHGMQICHLAAGDIYPYPHEAAGLTVLVVLQQTIDADPAPASVTLVEQTYLNTERIIGGAVDVALDRGGEEIDIFRVDGFFRLCEDIGRPILHAHAHHFDTLLGVENLVILKQPAEYTLLSGSQSFAHHVPHKYAGYSAFGIILLRSLAH